MLAPLKGGAVTSTRPNGSLQLLHEPDAVLELQAQGGEVLEERGAVDELDGGAHAVGRGQGLRHQLVLRLAQLP